MNCYLITHILFEFVKTDITEDSGDASEKVEGEERAVHDCIEVEQL